MNTINILKNYDFRLSCYDRYKILIKTAELLDKQKDKFSNLFGFFRARRWGTKHGAWRLYFSRN